MTRTSLIMDITHWLFTWKQLSTGILMALVLVSSIGVALSAHQTRQMYAQLQVIDLETDNLDSEYEKLLLEQSAWADYTRVDRVSRDELGMKPPLAKNMVIVKR
ncbi:MAG TPA: cell division protein FtsL [Pseudomonadales bacterium]|nr:cell division protein FtsL [Pseudomonadales bacterium]MDP6316042.1 cell division protein FtsL [Pseudomonadales bacterium]MDP7313962.1 cell division protein FtsL [Pseudomonadales bacterium]HJP52108.1 cell division protein FtsL [Pseudomonadales bacterium]